MFRILITGITGSIGSSIATELLRSDWRDVRLVALVRGQGGRSPAARVRDAVTDQCLCDGCPEAAPALMDRIEVRQGNIARPNLGLTDSLPPIDAVFHCAAHVYLGRKRTQHCASINEFGTRNMLSAARRFGFGAFHHVSTAYVAGRRSGLVYEDELQPAEFNNAYESSKYRAENLVRNAPMPFTIYRPGIVVGRLADGRVRKPSGFYEVLRFFASLKMRECAKRKVKCCDWITLPVRLQASPSARVYIVPSDYVQRTVVALFRQPPRGLTYHLTGRSPLIAEVVRETASRVLRIRGVQFVSRLSQPKRPEQLAERALRGLMPYFSSDAVFDVTNVERALGSESLDWRFDADALSTLVTTYLRRQFPELATGSMG